MIYSPPTVYEVRMPLLLNGARFRKHSSRRFDGFSANELTPQLKRAVIFSGCRNFDLPDSAAALLSHIALGPLEHISRSLDSMTKRMAGYRAG